MGGARVEARLGSRSRRGGGGDGARPTSVPDGAECETDRQASRVSAVPLRASLARLPRCLSFHPSAPASSFLSSAPITTPGGHCAPSRLPEHTRARGPTQTPPNLATISIAFPAETRLPCTASQTHPSRARRVGGVGRLDRVSPPVLLLVSPRLACFPEAPGQRQAKGPRLHLRPSRLGGFSSYARVFVCAGVECAGQRVHPRVCLPRVAARLACLVLASRVRACWCGVWCWL